MVMLRTIEWLQLDCLFERSMDRRGSYGDSELSGFDHKCALFVVHFKRLFVEFETNFSLLTRFEMNAFEGFQLFDRCGETGYFIAYIELNHLVAGTVTAVGNFGFDGYGDVVDVFVVCYLQVGVVKCGVA